MHIEESIDTLRKLQEAQSTLINAYQSALTVIEAQHQEIEGLKKPLIISGDLKFIVYLYETEKEYFVSLRYFNNLKLIAIKEVTFEIGEGLNET